MGWDLGFGVLGSEIFGSEILTSEICVGNQCLVNYDKGDSPRISLIIMDRTLIKLLTFLIFDLNPPKLQAGISTFSDSPL